MPKAVIYARVSSREQEKEGFSIPAQIKLLKEYALKRSFTIVQEFTDNETAKKEGRTNFNAMVSYLKAHKDVRIILVEKTDRLYRNFKDYVLLDDFDLEIHFVKEGNVLSKESRSHDKFIHGIKVLMAKNYIDNLSEEIKKGLHEKAEQGYWPLKPPFGYKKSENKLLIIDPETAPFVLRAFELYSDGYRSLEKVAEDLKEEGFNYKSYESKIKKGTLEKMLKNPLYKGSFLFKGQLFSGLHEPIVSQKLFNEVQQAFHKDNKPKYTSKEFLFAGLITCGSCGCSIVAETKKQKYTYYHCTWGKGSCDNTKYVREENLEEQFNNVVKNITVSDKQKEWIVKALKESLNDEKDFHNDKVSNLQKQALKLKERLNKIYEDKLDGLITEEFWLEKHNLWKSEHEKIHTLIQAYERTNIKYLENGVQILDLLNNAYSLYEKQPADEKRNLLNLLLSNCTIKGEELTYTYKKPFDIFAKGFVKEIKWRQVVKNRT